MDKLKTLKDFEYPEDISLWDGKRIKEYKKQEEKDCYDSIVKSNELRQEAIKWVKDIQNEMFRLGRQLGTGRPITRVRTWENMGKSNVLMDFFNLTEEDLKNE